MLPNKRLIELGKKYPNAWKEVEMFRKDCGVDLPRWPSWCFLPMAGWYAIVSEGNNVPRLDLHQVADVGRLAAIGTWRYSQGIYHFDNAFYASLINTVPCGDLPCDILYRLPEWCVYIETPGMQWLGVELQGFWCHLEWDANTERHELRLLLNNENLTCIPLHLGKWTLTESVDRALQEAKKQVATLGIHGMELDITEKLSESLYGLVSLILYLCSDEPEIDNAREPGTHPQRPQPKKTKQGWRLFPADKPRVWQVGQSLGENLRQIHLDAESGERGTVKPHLRRAHWHGFWSGSRDGEQTFHYHWLPPIFVAGKKK